MPLPAWLAATIPTAVNAIGGLFGGGAQSKANLRLAQYQYAQDWKMLQYQNEWNSPASQMKRFGEAGLNPNLVYGHGTPGNMESTPRFPNVQSGDYQSALAGIGTQFAQMKLMQSQAELTQQKVTESGVKQDLMKSQRSLVEANPYLNKSYVEAMVTNLESIAALKKQESDFMTIGRVSEGRFTGEAGMVKMRYELEALQQRFNLNNADQKIKAQILESKEFQNALQDIQLKWMRDKEITPQHIYQGIMMLLSKMM